MSQNFSPSESVLNVRRLPARLDYAQAAKVLGMQPHDIPVLVQAKHLVPLGKPLPNSTKYFAAVSVEQHAADPGWLDVATRIIARHWLKKNGRNSQRSQIDEAA